MHRRDFLYGAAAAGLAAAANQFACVSSPLSGIRRRHDLKMTRTGRPNILLITTDQERYRLPTSAGFALPQRERLMAQGLTFRNHHATTAPCTPSRSVMYTGQHVPHTHMFDNLDFPYVDSMSDKLETLGTMMRAAGYYTAYKGKWHLSGGLAGSDDGKPKPALADALERFGFSDFSTLGDDHGKPWGGHTLDAGTATDVGGWLATRGRDVAKQQPWLMVASFINPHDIMFIDSDGAGAVQETRGPFKIRAAPATELYAKDWQPELPASFADDLSTKPVAQRDYQTLMNLAVGTMPLDREDMWRANLNYYLNCLREVDLQIGVVLDALERSGMAANTIVVFTSDHGEMGGAHGLRQKGPLVYQENVNVPLVIRHPDAIGGTTTDALSSAVDLVPTLLALAGVNQTLRRAEFPELVGYDVSDLIAHPAGKGPRGDRGLLFTYDALNSVDVGFWVHIAGLMEQRVFHGKFINLLHLRPDLRKRGFIRGVFDGRYKLARYFAPTDYNRPQTFESLLAANDVELYDVATDPHEMTNLARDPLSAKQLLTALNTKLENLIASEIGDDTTLSLPRLRVRA